jgi:hypothetical protein
VIFVGRLQRYSPIRLSIWTNALAYFAVTKKKVFYNFGYLFFFSNKAFYFSRPFNFLSSFTSFGRKAFGRQSFGRKPFGQQVFGRQADGQNHFCSTRVDVALLIQSRPNVNRPKCFRPNEVELSIRLLLCLSLPLSLSLHLSSVSSWALVTKLFTTVISFHAAISDSALSTNLLPS